MEVDDTLFKKALGELMVCSARSLSALRQIELFLNSTDPSDLVLFRRGSDPASGFGPISMEPGRLLLEFLESLRGKPCIPDTRSR